MTMVKRIFSGLMILLFSTFIMFIWGCGKDTPTEPIINAQGKVNDTPKTPGIGRVGETLSNGYYKVTIEEIRDSRIIVEIENIGNKEASYVGPFNFSVIAADSQVYAVGPSEGVKLNVGQKKEFYFTVKPDKTGWAFSEEGSLFVFQAYTDIIPAGEKNNLFLPKGKAIGRPIVFNPRLFVPKVLTVEPKPENDVLSTGTPEPENDVLSTGTIEISFSSPVDEKSIKGISMTGGKITTVIPRYPGGSIIDKRVVIVILQGVAPGSQTLDVSAVTDQAGERLSGVTTFKFFVKPDKTTPTIVESKPTKGQTNIKPELYQSISITFSEPMNTDTTKIIIDPPINGQNQLAINWQIKTDWYNPYGLGVAFTQLATMQLNQSLACSTEYTLTIRGEDLVGNKIEDKIVFETYTPDLIPPEIAGDRCDPKNGAKGIDPVWVNKIVIVFTEAMSEVKVESFEPREAHAIPFGEFHGGDTLTLSFLGGDRLWNGMDVVITLSGKDKAGNSLKTTVYHFETMRALQ